MATGDYDAIIRQLLEEALQQKSQGQQVAENDGFNPVAALGAQGYGAEVYDRAAKRPNRMAPNQGRRMSGANDHVPPRLYPMNDNGNFFGRGW